MIYKQTSGLLFWAVLAAFLSAADVSFSADTNRSPQSSLLLQADSLFTIRQFRESAAAYRSLFSTGLQSPAANLRAAYLAEAAGRRDETLLYLYRFYLLTDDQAAFDKLSNLAQQYGVAGYERSDREYLMHRFSRSAPAILKISMALLVLNLAALVFLKRRNIQQGRKALVITSMIIATTIFAANNFSDPPLKAIVTESGVLVFDGPSAAADRKGLLSPGDLIEVDGTADIWLRIRHRGKTSFVRRSQVEVI